MRRRPQEQKTRGPLQFKLYYTEKGVIRVLPFRTLEGAHSVFNVVAKTFSLLTVIGGFCRHFVRTTRQSGVKPSGTLLSGLPIQEGATNVSNAVEREKDELLRQKDVLLKEMKHRIANSLQIIANILMLKARTVQSAETRQHLHDAHQRVLSLASVQSHLEPSESIDDIRLDRTFATCAAALRSRWSGTACH